MAEFTPGSVSPNATPREPHAEGAPRAPSPPPAPWEAWPSSSHAAAGWELLPKDTEAECSRAVIPDTAPLPHPPAVPSSAAARGFPLHKPQPQITPSPVLGDNLLSNTHTAPTNLTETEKHRFFMLKTPKFHFLPCTGVSSFGAEEKTNLHTPAKCMHLAF